MSQSKNYPALFDTSQLTDKQKQLLSDFFARRKKFDQFIADNKLKLFTCPSCGYPTLPKRGSCDICKICGWEDDRQNDPHADEIRGGPNYNLSLTESRLSIGVYLEKAGISPTDTTISMDEILQRICLYNKHWHKRKGTLH